MDGVTILNTYTETVGTDSQIFQGVLAAMFIMAGGLMLTLVLTIWFDISENAGDLLLLLCAIAGVICGYFVGTRHSEYKEVPMYEVTISDDVSFAEFSEKYEIVEQRGEIYVVKEKEPSDE